MKRHEVMAPEHSGVGEVAERVQWRK